MQVNVKTNNYTLYQTRKHGIYKNEKLLKMKKSKLSILVFIVLSVMAGFFTMEMTASNPYSLKYYLIYLPLLTLIVLEFYLVSKIRASKKNIILYKILSYCIIPLVLFTFLFFSFGEAKNKICVTGDCENGYGEALYIKSERTYKSGNGSNEGELLYYSPEFLGRNWFNNIVWYDGNPITHVYRGNFKNGCFDGVGQEFWFTYEYEENHMFDEDYKFIDGIYLVEGEWERGWLFWDNASRKNGPIKMNQEIERILYDYNLDKKGYYHGK